MTEHERMVEANRRYLAAAHAMQSGVAYEMHNRDGTASGEAAHSPKHLRTGVNSAMVSHAALVELLVAKGLITRLEYTEALADVMEAEVKRYEERAGGIIKFA